MNRVVTGSSLPTSENTLEATVEVPVTTAHQLLTGTPAPLLWKVDVEGLEPQVLRGAATQAGSGHNQLWIRDLPFPRQRCRTPALVRVGRMARFLHCREAYKCTILGDSALCQLCSSIPRLNLRQTYRQHRFRPAAAAAAVASIARERSRPLPAS
jgi:hypothetical protein